MGIWHHHHHDDEAIKQVFVGRRNIAEILSLFGNKVHTALKRVNTSGLDLNNWSSSLPVRQHHRVKGVVSYLWCVHKAGLKYSKSDASSDEQQYCQHSSAITQNVINVEKCKKKSVNVDKNVVCLSVSHSLSVWYCGHIRSPVPTACLLDAGLALQGCGWGHVNEEGNPMFTGKMTRKTVCV